MMIISYPTLGEGGSLDDSSYKNPLLHFINFPIQLLYSKKVFCTIIRFQVRQFRLHLGQSINEFNIIKMFGKKLTNTVLW